MPEHESNSNELSLKDRLMAADHEKLVDILISMYENNYEMQNHLDIFFIGLDEDPKRLIDLINREISEIKSSTEYIDYYAIDSFCNHLSFICSRIANDLNNKSPKHAFEIMLRFLNLYESIIDRAKDDGVIGDVFIMACKDLGRIAQNNTHLSVSEIVDLVFSLFTNDDYSIYNNIISDFSTKLGNKGLDLIQKNLEETNYIKNSFLIKHGLKAVADCKNDIDAYISACKLTGELSDKDYINIVERLISHQRAKEALEWLERMQTLNNCHWEQERKELRIQALELDGRYDQAQSERVAWFWKKLCPKLYKHILKYTQLDFKEEFKLNAINYALQFPEPYTAFRFLIEIEEFDKVAKFVRLRHSELSGVYYYTLRPAADMLQTIDPLAAIIIYRKIIEDILRESKPKCYKYAARDLVICSILDTKITDWQEFQQHDVYFKNIAIQHKRKSRLWSEYNLALQEQSETKMKIKD